MLTPGFADDRVAAALKLEVYSRHILEAFQYRRLGEPSRIVIESDAG